MIWCAIYSPYNLEIIIAVVVGGHGTVLYCKENESNSKVYRHRFHFLEKQVYIVVQVHILDGILNGTIECPAQLLDDNNAP